MQVGECDLSIPRHSLGLELNQDRATGIGYTFGFVNRQAHFGPLESRQSGVVRQAQPAQLQLRLGELPCALAQAPLCNGYAGEFPPAPCMFRTKPKPIEDQFRFEESLARLHMVLSRQVRRPGILPQPDGVKARIDPPQGHNPMGSRPGSTHLKTKTDGVKVRIDPPQGHNPMGSRSGSTHLKATTDGVKVRIDTLR